MQRGARRPEPALAITVDDGAAAVAVVLVERADARCDEQVVGAALDVGVIVRAAGDAAGDEARERRRE